MRYLRYLVIFLITFTLSCQQNKPEGSQPWTEVADFDDSILNDLDVLSSPVLFELLNASKYGPFYSKPIVVKKDGKLIKEIRYCFEISQTQDRSWKVNVKMLVDADGDHVVDSFGEDIDGDGKWDRGKYDRDGDGKFEKRWIDSNGDGKQTLDEIEPIDPPENAPNMPGWF
ncbi:hypothetical protein [Ekhidna sp.]|uniref:hypothetical protein n=1 Tax=Ekhidna sp. TaxID=2608089 RepID=UPI003299BA2C